MNKFQVTKTENNTDMKVNMTQLNSIGQENQQLSETKRSLQTVKEEKTISLKISPSLSQMLMQFQKINTPLKNHLTGLDNFPRSEYQFSAQSHFMGNKCQKTDQRCQKLEKTMQGLQQLILSQRARAGQTGGITKNSECVSVKKSFQGVAQLSNDAQKQQNLQKLLALASLMNKKQEDHSKMNLGKQQSQNKSLFENQEGSNTLFKATNQLFFVKTCTSNVPVKSKFGQMNFTAQNSFMKQSPLFGQNILKPIFERKTQDNLQNLLNSTPTMEKANSICKTYPNSAEVSDCKLSGEKKTRYSNFTIASFKNMTTLNIDGQKQSECSEDLSQTNLKLDHQQSAFKKIQPQRSFTDKMSITPREVLSGDDTSPVTIQSPGRSDNLAIGSPVKIENSLEKQKSLQLKQLNLSQLQLLLKEFSTSSMGCSYLKPSELNESPMLNDSLFKGSPKVGISLDQFKFKLPKIKQNTKKANLINEQVTKQFQNTSHQFTAGSDEKENFCPVDHQLLGKRKRKTERELKILRSELRKNIMWTRESIKHMRKLYEDDFSMSEQQIYKWWWDQTRKRTKKNESKKAGQKFNENIQTDENQTEDDELLISFQDEFGGYSSRLRLNGNGQTIAKEQKAGEDAENIDLCALLGIDVEGIALRLALGLDQDDDDVSAVGGYNTDIKKLNTAATLNSGVHKQFNHSIAIAEALSPILSHVIEEEGQTRINFAQNKMMIDELMNGIDYTTRKNSFTTENHQPERRVADQNEIGETTTRHVSFSTQESQ